MNPMHQKVENTGIAIGVNDPMIICIEHDDWGVDIRAESNDLALIA